MSVCSEPATVSIHPAPVDIPTTQSIDNASELSTNNTAGQKSKETDILMRPTSLMLTANRAESKPPTITERNESDKFTNESEQPTKQVNTRKPLFRSNSSSLHKKPSLFVPIATSSATEKFKLSNELDKIFVISDCQASNLDDSIKVIDERRMKNMPKSDRARLYKSNTIICEEYYRDEPFNEPNDITKAIAEIASDENVDI